MKIYLPLLVFALVASPLHTSAQPRRDILHGSIEMENSSKRPTITMADVKKEANGFVNGVHEQALALGQGQPGKAVNAPSDVAYQFLAVSYLYCSVNLGVCPSLLDTLLEADVIRSRQTKQPACPHLTKFWAAWIASDMEKRHQYLVKTGYLNDTNNFRSRVRPKYIKCQDTIAEIIKADGSDTDFFRNRYTDGSETMKSLKRANEVLKEIEQKENDIADLVGVRMNLVR